MGKFRQSLLFVAIVVMLVSACTTGARVSGPDSFKLERRIGDLDYYEIGDPSLPSARRFAKKRARAFREISDDESSLRVGATAITLGALLSAFGLSLTGAGSTEAFTVLGLAGSTAGGASRLYTNRMRQNLLEDGSNSLQCLIAATSPYLITHAAGQELFGTNYGRAYMRSGAVAPMAKTELGRLLDASESDGVLTVAEKADILRRAGASLGTVDLMAILDAAERAGALSNGSRKDLLDRMSRASLDQLLTDALLEAEAAKAILNQTMATLGDGKADKPATAALERAISTMTDGKDALVQLSGFTQGVRRAGPQLERHVESVITVMRKEIIRLEPDPKAAAAEFASIKTNLAGFFGAVKADESMLKGLSGLAAGKTATGTTKPLSSGSPPYDSSTEIARLNRAVKALMARTARAQKILRDFENSKTDIGALKDCPAVTTSEALIISPSARQISLAAGKTQKLEITAGSQPAVAETNDPSNVLTVSAVTGGAGGRYEVVLTAAETVAALSTAEIEITLASAGLKKLKTITIAAGSAVTITVTPTADQLTIPRGKSGSFTVKTSDGNKPTAKRRDGDDFNDKYFLAPKITEITSAKNTFDVKFSIKKDAPTDVNSFMIVIKSSDGQSPVEKELVLGPAAGEGTPPKRDLTDLEKIEKLVGVVQTFLNGKDIKAEGAADLEQTGKFDEETRKRLLAYKKKAGDTIGLVNDELNDATVVHIRDKLIKKNLAAITAKDSVSTDQIQQVEDILLRGFSDSVIKKNGTLELAERGIIWSAQLSFVKSGKPEAAAINITGALDQATFDALIKIGSK